jgi:DNA-binding response OmpR family regulator
MKKQPAEMDSRGNESPADLPEEIKEIKRRLLSHITHEFLTPLNLLIVPIEQLLGKCQDEDQKKTLSMMYRNGQRLLIVIHQVLELLKLESRNFNLKARQQDLVTFLKGILANFELLALQKEVALIFNCNRDHIPLYFDQEKLAEVICNLVMNSLNHTPPGGRVTLSVRETPGNSVEIAMQDTGTGIPPDQTSQIFDRFYQLTEQSEHYIKGLGIGLFLSREYIKLHHGAIQVNSGEGKGTEFVIQLPKGKDHLLADEIQETPDSSEAGEVGGKISKRYAYMLELEKDEQEKERMLERAISTVDAEEQKQDVVLVCEDNADMRTFIKTMLTEEGFIATEAENGREGIDMARKIIPDIIISDIMMPQMNGYELCRQLKSDVNTSHIPIILLSVKFENEEIVRGLESGADDYITKPFNMDILLTRVKNLINQRRRLQQRIQMEMVGHSAELDLSSLDNQFIKNLRETIEKNLSEPEFGLDEMADALYMSRTTLYRKLISLTGQPPKRFIQSYRLKRSLELLKNNFGNVTEVAYKVGFSNSAYFTKCFKESFNRLPSDFTVS